MTSFKLFLSTLFVAILFITTSNLQAQTYKWEFGVEAGAGIRSLRTNPTDSAFKTDIGFTGGIAGQYNMSPMLSLRLGAAYERKGAKFETTGGTTTTTAITGKVNVDYISIPLLLRVTFGKGKEVNFFVNAGPFVGILLANKIKVDAFGTNPETEIDNKDSTKKVDFGITGGLGVSFLVGKNMGFTVEARDNFGLTDINDRKTTIIEEIKTNSANLLLGFNWKFGRGPMRRKK